MAHRAVLAELGGGTGRGQWGFYGLEKEGRNVSTGRMTACWNGTAERHVFLRLSTDSSERSSGRGVGWVVVVECGFG